jgi:hypothetical protein
MEKLTEEPTLICWMQKRATNRTFRVHDSPCSVSIKVAESAGMVNAS